MDGGAEVPIRGFAIAESWVVSAPEPVVFGNRRNVYGIAARRVCEIIRNFGNTLPSARFAGGMEPAAKITLRIAGVSHQGIRIVTPTIGRTIAIAEGIWLGVRRCLDGLPSATGKREISEVRRVLL